MDVGCAARLLGALVFLAVINLAAPRAAAAADPPVKVVRVGYLAIFRPGGAPMMIVPELRKLGYVEGKNLVMEFRHADGNPERLPGAAAELVKLNVDVIFAVSNRAAFAAQRATRAISRSSAGAFTARSIPASCPI